MLTSEVLLLVENAPFKVLNFLGPFESSFSINSLLQFVNLLNCQERQSNAREFLQSFDEVLNVLVIRLGLINIKHEESLDILEFGFLFDELFELHLVLL